MLSRTTYPANSIENLNEFYEVNDIYEINEMAKYETCDSNLPYDLWFDVIGKRRQYERHPSWAITPWVKVRVRDYLYPVSISTTPSVLANDNTYYSCYLRGMTSEEDRNLEMMFDFISRNRDLIMAHWYDEISNQTLLNGLKSRQQHCLTCKNKVIKVNNEQKMQSIIRKAINEKINVVEIDGFSSKTWEDYVDAVETGFGLPDVRGTRLYKNKHSILSIDGHVGWIKEYREHLIRKLDVMGYVEEAGRPDCDGHMLVIYNYSEFLKTNFRLRDEVIGDYANRILPLWEQRGKPFNLYLVD